jgi:hypothetical protein
MNRQYFTSPVAWACWLVLALLAAWLSLVPASVAADADGQTQQNLKLAERIDKLERAVLVDPFHPNTTVLARLDSLERSVREIVQGDPVAGRADARALDDLRKSLERVERDRAEMDKRLVTVERTQERHQNQIDQQQQRGGGDEAGRQVREIRNDLEQMSRSLDDLRDRLTRLERK